MTSFLTMVEVAERLTISVRAVARYIRAGRIPAPQRFGTRTLRWHTDDMADLFRNGPKPPGTFGPDTTNAPRESSRSSSAGSPLVPPIAKQQARRETKTARPPIYGAAMDRAEKQGAALDASLPPETRAAHREARLAYEALHEANGIIPR